MNDQSVMGSIVTDPVAALTHARDEARREAELLRNELRTANAERDAAVNRAAVEEQRAQDWRTAAEEAGRFRAAAEERASAAEARLKRFADEAMAGLAGVVCTPEEGYLKAQHCFLGDLAALRRRAEDLERELASLRGQLDQAHAQQRKLAELSSTGLLWWINRTAFHPSGFALAIDREEDGRIVGWRLLGAGNEVFTFSESDDVECFKRVMATFTAARAAATTMGEETEPLVVTTATPPADGKDGGR